MPSADTLHLQFASAEAEPIQRCPHSWPGFRIEKIDLETDEPYAFHADGDWHYLALHDLTLLDGELQIDGLPKLSQTDLRDTLTFAPGGCVIDGWAKPTSRRNSFTALYFDPQTISADLGGRYAQLDPGPFAYARNPSLAATMRKLTAIASAADVDDLYAETLCLSAALEIFGVQPPSEAGQLSRRQLQTIYDYIEANLSERIMLDDLAEIARVSRSHFSRSFKATTGLGPHSFIRQRQIERARELLMQRPPLSVETVAHALGFHSANVFRRAFQQSLGLSPQEYRLAKR